MANESEQRKVICNHLRLIPLDEVQTVFRLSPSLFSQPCRFRRAVKSASFPPGEAKGAVRIRLSLSKNAASCRTPQPLRRQLSSALSGCTPSRTATPAKPFRGAWGLGCADCILNWILRTANPSATLTRGPPPLSGEVGYAHQKRP